jgi:hypothetical protein
LDITEAGAVDVYLLWLYYINPGLSVFEEMFLVVNLAKSVLFPTEPEYLELIWFFF